MKVNNCRLYKGKGKPWALYEGTNKIAGWILESKSGNDLLFAGTYNDNASVVVHGNHKEINPKTNIIPSNKVKFDGWTKYGGANVTVLQGQAVPEWNTTEATRLQISGGIETLKYYTAVASTPPTGSTYGMALKIKNNGTHALVIQNNVTGVRATVQPGEMLSFVENGITWLGAGNLQIRFHTTADGINDGLDITLHEPTVYREYKSPESPYLLQGNTPKKVISSGQGVINLIPAANRKFANWETFGGATVTLEQGQVVPEWGTVEATRIRTSGGTTQIKYYASAGYIPGTSEVFVAQIYVKNIGVNTLRINSNLGNRVKDVAPGETFFYNEVGIQGNGTLSMQIQFRTIASQVGEPLDFVAWQPIITGGKVEIETLLPSIAPLRSLPSGIKDLYDISTGKITRFVGYKVFDGTESLYKSSATGILQVRSAIPEAPPGLWNVRNGYCTHYQLYNWRPSPAPSPFVWVAGINCWFDLLETDFGGTVEGLRSWLVAQYAAGTPVAVAYELVTPIIEYAARASPVTLYPQTKITTTDIIGPDTDVVCKIRDK